MKKIFLLFLFTTQLFAQSNLTGEHLNDIRKSILLNSLLNNADSGSFKEYYLGCDWELILKVERFEKKFPIEGEAFTLYEVTNKFFSFRNPEKGIDMERTYIDGGYSKYFLLSRLNLVAVDEKNNLFYIGGSFEKSSIAGTLNYFKKVLTHSLHSSK